MKKTLASIATGFLTLCLISQMSVQAELKPVSNQYDDKKNHIHLINWSAFRLLSISKSKRYCNE